MNAPQPDRPIIVHGLDLSYFTGKFEGYLRAKGIAYRLQEMDTASFRRCARETGVAQMPQVEFPDGTWRTDTPRLIDYFETVHPAPAITPVDPVARFVSHLLEDYGDEWLWRPALYYRWAFAEDARLMSGRIARGLLADVAGPFWLKRRFMLHRQRRRYLRQDGVTRATAPAIEKLYLDTLDAMESALATRDFLQGERPTRADFGFFGSMFRHFASDPTPSSIMRARAPRTALWVARLWALEPATFETRPAPTGVPANLEPIARAIATDFLPYMRANADAFERGAATVEWRSAGVAFVTPVNPYRVWRHTRCLALFAELEASARSVIASWLGESGVALLAAPAPRKIPDVTTAAPRDREWR